MKALVLGATGAIGKDLVEQWADMLIGDVLFSTLGTTIKAAVPYPEGK